MTQNSDLNWIHDPQRLSRLIGRTFHYRGQRCRAVDVLADGPSVVLERISGMRVIQSNQYGEAWREAPELHTVRLLNPRGDALNPLLTLAPQATP